MKALRLMFIIGILMSFAVTAMAQDVVAPAESEDINAFDPATKVTKNKFEEKRLNKNEAEDSEFKHQYRERRKLNEDDAYTEEGDSDGKKVMNKTKKMKKTKSMKKYNSSEDYYDEAIKEEAKKLKKEGDIDQKKTRERIRERIRENEGVKEQTKAGSGQASDVIPGSSNAYKGENGSKSGGK